MGKTIKKVRERSFASHPNKTTLEDVKNNEAILGVYEGPIQKKTANDNDRVYTEEFWNQFFESAQTKKRLERNLFLGRMTHPSEGVEFDLNKASHTVTRVWDGACKQEVLQESETIESPDDELIYGRIWVLNTEAGQNLQTMLDAGIKLGVSSRSLVVSEKKDGMEYIDEGEVFGWDYVAIGSVAEALPKQVKESLTMDVTEEGIDLDFGDEEVIIEEEDFDNFMEELESSDHENAKVIRQALKLEEQYKGSDDDEEEGDEDEKEGEESSEEGSEEGEDQDVELEEVVPDGMTAVEFIQDLQDEMNHLEEEIDNRDERYKGTIAHLFKQNGQLRDRQEQIIEAFESFRTYFEYYEDYTHEVLSQFKENLEEASDSDAMDDELKEAVRTLVRQVNMREKQLDLACESLDTMSDEYHLLHNRTEQEIDKLEQEFSDRMEEYEEQVKRLKKEKKKEAYKAGVEVYAICMADKHNIQEDKLVDLLIESETHEEVDAKINRLQNLEQGVKDGLPFATTKQAFEEVKKKFGEEGQQQEDNSRLERDKSDKMTRIMEKSVGIRK